MAGRNGGSMIYRACKRTFDVVFSACVAVVGFVPGLVLCIFVARDTGGSPLYTQERIGLGGKAFRMYKFRTMVVDSDDVERHLNEEQLAQWRRERKVDNDPRITPMGRFLRKTSLDEIPQFLNVLLGQMSVVGPRPVVTDELEEFAGPEQAEFLSVRPGVTGWWQVTSRNDATWENGRRQALELEYVRDAGFAMDARVLARTFSVMFGRRKTGR